MALPAYPSNLSFSQIQTEFGGSNPISLGEYYAGASNGYVLAGKIGGLNGGSVAIPSSGAIKVGNFHNSSNQVPITAGFYGSDAYSYGPTYPANYNAKTYNNAGISSFPETGTQYGFPLVTNLVKTGSADPVVAAYGTYHVVADGTTPYFYVTNTNSKSQLIYLTCRSYSGAHVYLYTYIYTSSGFLLYSRADYPNMNTERYIHLYDFTFTDVLPANTTRGYRMRMIAGYNGDYDYSRDFAGMKFIYFSSGGF